MADALSAPFAAAALVLCVAGLAKLRSPAPAVNAVIVAGLPPARGLVQAFAAAEVAIGGWSLVGTSPLPRALVAALYLAFALLSVRLAANRASCGCFGGGDAPASLGQSALSAMLAALSLAACLAPAHGVFWIVDRPLGEATVLLAGILAAAYALVLAYARGPRAWSSWSAG